MMKQSKFFTFVFLIIFCLVALGMRVAASDTPITLEVVWKADTATHPILNGGNIAVDGQGNLYTTDYGADGYTYQVAKFDSEGQFVTSWGKTGDGPGEFKWRPDNPEDGPDGGFLAADAEGNVYVSDGNNFRVQKFDTNGKFLLEWSTLDEELDEPLGPGPISIDPDGNVYVPDFAHVQKFDSEGQFISSFGSSGTGEGEFIGAAQVGWDSEGNLYVPDFLNARLEKFDSEGNFLMQVGTSGEGDGEFNLPLQAVVDSQDHVFITDNSSRLQMFDTEGNFVAKWTEPGNGDGPFMYAGSVAIDSEDNIYIAFYEEAGYSFYKFSQQ